MASRKRIVIIGNPSLDPECCIALVMRNRFIEVATMSPAMLIKHIFQNFILYVGLVALLPKMSWKMGGTVKRTISAKFSMKLILIWVLSS
ncbi:MAG: hypothetical protein ABFD02_12615 [Bacteroidales bacterium]